MSVVRFFREAGTTRWMAFGDRGTYYVEEPDGDVGWLLLLLGEDDEDDGFVGEYPTRQAAFQAARSYDADD